MIDTNSEPADLTGLDDYLRDPSVGLPWDIRIRIADALRLQQAEIARLTAESDAKAEARDMMGRLWEIEKSRAEKAEADCDAALAQVAGAYEAAAQALEAPEWSDCGCMDAGCRGRHAEKLEALEFAAADIRALTPADATTALDRIKRQARAEGMRKAAQIAVDFDGGDVSNPWEWPNRIAAATLAAAEQEERGDE